MKRIIAEHAVFISLAFGAVLFLVAYFVISGLASWPPLVGALGAAIAFVITVIGTFAFTRNIVDAYTLQVAAKQQVVMGLLQKMESYYTRIKNKNAVDCLRRIDKHSFDLIERTRESQPNNLLSAITVLENWLKLVCDLNKQYVDVEQHPEYQDNPEARLTNANAALESFDLFLLNSIKAIEKGDNVQFDLATKMLDSAKFHIV
jgi:hypothetical protein